MKGPEEEGTTRSSDGRRTAKKAILDGLEGIAGMAGGWQAAAVALIRWIREQIVERIGRIEERVASLEGRAANLEAATSNSQTDGADLRAQVVQLQLEVAQLRAALRVRTWAAATPGAAAVVAVVVALVWR